MAADSMLFHFFLDFVKIDMRLVYITLLFALLSNVFKFSRTLACNIKETKCLLHTLEYDFLGQFHPFSVAGYLDGASLVLLQYGGAIWLYS